MNDFTKEELFDLQSWGDAYTSYDADSDIYKMHEPLLTKIQSLIDNYCEHDWDNPCCGCPDSSPYCIKCERKIYDN